MAKRKQQEIEVVIHNPPSVEQQTKWLCELVKIIERHKMSELLGISNENKIE